MSDKSIPNKPTPSKPAPSKLTPSQRILYIEDNFMNRMLVSRVLQVEGYTIIEAEDGASGLALAAKEKPDLILMDINLPDIDGYECTRRIRKNPDIKDIPIVAMTANAIVGDKDKAIEAGCNGYISKPIDIDKLPEQVKKYLNGK